MIPAQANAGLPGTSRLGHYVYVVQFNSGTIKIGRTGNPASRLKSHATAARPHGIFVAAQWLSQPHPLARRNEIQLVEFCHTHFKSTNDGEYFMDARVDDVIAFAETLPVSQHMTDRLQFTRFGRVAGRGGSWPDAEPVIVLPLSLDILSEVDAVRGTMSRAHWIQEAVSERLACQSRLD
ncbi:GIY-YIG nuclease family protein [Nonomuraea sp. NPDC050536]|uniref:GIY-YIG nuclease family protein n=1 Tax=Nonomuraea sp. NPDC050536 TaxID=3364366 RepID=UPI0037C9BA67